jgi:drug/metabolite transporter (DMT)-like permease
MTALARLSSHGVFSNAYLLLIIAPLLWGGNAVAGRLATLDWQPFTLTSLRWLCAAIYLLPFAIGPLKRDWPILKSRLWLLFLMGGFGMAMFNLSMYWALTYTTAINVSIEQASMPMLIMLANFIFLSQRVRWLQIVGLILTLTGVLVTATAGEPGRFFSEGLNRGDAIMLVGCLFYAGYTFGLRWRPAIHWMSFMWVISASAFIITIPFAGWELAQVGFAMPGFGGWMVLLYVIIFPTVISQLAFARGVEMIGANRAGLFVNLVPIFGSLLAVLILNEQFRWFHLAGLTLVLAGITLAERAAEKPPIKTLEVP